MQRVAATYGDPSAFSELVFGTPLHAGQRRYCEGSTADVNFLLPGNSWGKTEFIARKVIYDAWFKDGTYRPTSFKDWLGQEYKALVASYNYPIARESFDRLEVYLRNREELKALVGHISKSDPVRVELNNGAIIDWGSLDGQGKLVEAARRRVVYVDEAGHIPDISATFDNILFPRTMGVGGRIHLLGTPKAHSDPYLLEVYEKGRTGEDPFYFSQSGSVFENEFWPEAERQRVIDNPRYVKGWTKCPENGCDFVICREREPGKWFHPVTSPIGRQVMLGEFVITGGYFFSRPHIGRMFTGDHNVQWSGETHFHEGEWSVNDQGVWQRRDSAPAGRLYLGAFDLGGNKQRKRKKKGSDPTVGFVIDYTDRPWRIVHYQFIEGGEMDWQQKYETMSHVFQGYPMTYLCIDSTGQIDSVQEALQDRGVDVEGVHFGGNSNRKYDMLRNLQLVMELEWGNALGVLRSPLIPKLKYELDHYVLPDDDIEQDNVMALAMAAYHVAQWELPAPLGGEVY